MATEMEKAFKICRERETFTDEDNILIDSLLEGGDIETEDLRVDFKEWVYENYPDVDKGLVWDYDEHYSNGLTHRENYKELVTFIRNQ